MPLVTVGSATLLGGATAAISEAWTWKKGRKAQQEEELKELQDVQRLALQLLGSVLFESKANLDVVFRMVAAGDKDNGFVTEVCDFSVGDALMTDLCKVVPSPKLLELVRSVVAGLKHVDFLQRVALGAPLLSSGGRNTLGIATHSPDIGKYRAARDAADEFAASRVFEVFNCLVAFIDEFGRSVYGDGWAGAEGSNMMPAPLDIEAWGRLGPVRTAQKLEPTPPSRT